MRRADEDRKGGRSGGGSGTAGGRGEQEAGPRSRTSPFTWGLAVTLGGGLAFGLLTVASTLLGVLVYAGVALFLALALDPVIRRLTGRGVPRGVAVGIVIVLAVAALGAVLGLLVPAVTQQAIEFVRSLPAIGDEVARLPVVAALDLDDLATEGADWLMDAGRLATLGGGLLSVGAGIVDGAVAVVSVTVLAVYFAATLPAAKRVLTRAVPASRRERFSALMDEIFLSTGRYVGGQLVLALLNAAFVLVVLLIAGAPVPSLLALVAFVGALIPVVGTVIAYAVITASVLIVSPTTALVVGLVLLAYAQVEAYVLTPRVMSRAVQVPGALVILAALGGSTLGGVLGALVAVPVVAAGVLIFERVVVPAQDGR